jgi:hypothetical protein
VGPTKVPVCTFYDVFRVVVAEVETLTGDDVDYVAAYKTVCLDY